MTHHNPSDPDGKITLAATVALALNAAHNKPTEAQLAERVRAEERASWNKMVKLRKAAKQARKK